MIGHDDVTADRNAMFVVRAASETHETVVNGIGREERLSSMRAGRDKEDWIAWKQSIERGRNSRVLGHGREGQHDE